MVLGRRPPAVLGMLPAPPPGPKPPAAKYTFGRPTDVAWDPQGNIFVSDGYVNHRVVKFDKNGRFVKQVGSENAGSEPSQFSTPHGIAVDAQRQRLRRRPRATTACRCSTTTWCCAASTTTSACRGPSASRRVRISTCSRSNSNPNGNTPGSWDITGEIYKMELDGTILGKFGHAGKQLGGFQVVHMMDCRNPDQIVVAEIESWRVQKLMLKPAAGRPSRPADDGSEIRRPIMKRIIQLAVGVIGASRSRRWPRNSSSRRSRMTSPIEPLKLPPASELRRSGRRRDKFERRRVRLHADRPSDALARHRAPVRARRFADVPVRQDRQVRRRDRPGLLRHAVRARRSRSIRRTTSGSSIRCRTPSWSSIPKVAS